MAQTPTTTIRRSFFDVLFAAAAIAAVTASPKPALAFTNCQTALQDPARNRVEMASEIVLERLSGRDLLADNANRGVSVTSETELNQALRRPSTVERAVPSLWRIRIPRTVTPASLNVTHHVTGTGARENAFSLDEDTTRTMPVNVSSLSPITVCRNDAHQIVEGGVRVELDLNKLPSAGRYRLAILTEVDVP